MTANNSPQLTPIEQALESLLAAMKVVTQEQIVPTARASGRVLARAMVSPIDVPPQANSAMDGYAVRSADLAGAPLRLAVSQRIAAGAVGTELSTGTVARIFTGAPLPPGADAVVMQENSEPHEEAVTLLQAVAAGENVRPAGEDLRQGQELFPAGHRLRPQDLGVLATAGIDEVTVTRPLRAAVMTTGDELVRPGTPLRPGQIYNANVYTLTALLQALGVEVIDLGIVPDDEEQTRRALVNAAKSADCIISTGGVSVGEEDYVRKAVMASGSLALWKLAIKPGKPFAFGEVGGACFFGLPGNPVSTFVTFVLLVRPCLLAMSGCRRLAPLSLRVAAGFSRPRSAERQEYLRVALTAANGQEPRLQPYDNQSSGVSASLSGADGLAIIPPHTAVAQDDRLVFIPFSELLH
ncbi:MAG: gephyrin-like molybdotransferase Glp [Pseudohongiellaceae bacterium]